MRRRVTLASCLAAAAAVAAIAAGPGAAGAGPQVTLKFDPPDRFFGKLEAKPGKCERHRRVDLRYWMTPGGGPDVLGHDKTNGKGKWELTLPTPAIEGDYQAFAGKVEKGDTTCKAVKGVRIHF